MILPGHIIANLRAAASNATLKPIYYNGIDGNPCDFEYLSFLTNNNYNDAGTIQRPDLQVWDWKQALYGNLKGCSLTNRIECILLRIHFRVC